MNRLLLKFLDRALARGDETALAAERGLRVVRWSYAQLAQRAFQFARELEARGIGKGDRVLFWDENSPEWVAGFFGCLLRGAIVVPLDQSQHPDFARRVQQQVEAKLLLCGDEQRRHFDGKTPILRFDGLSEAIDHHSSAPYETEEIDQDDLVEIIFTSGTTAEPKGVCLTHRNLLANIAPLEIEINKYLGYERPFHPIRFLCLLPLSHVFGQFMGVFVPQLLGGEAFFQSSFNPSEIITNVKRERISVIAAVPRQLETLRDKIERDMAARGELEEFRRRFASAEGKHFLRRWWIFRDVHRRFGWKFWAFVSGGATLEEETESFWQRLGFAVVQGYGMTETASLVSVNHPFKLSRGSIGKTLPGQEVKLDAGGEILVRGANVSAGYWRGGAQAMTAGEGWLRTGDVGAVDEAGNLFFKGRKKDVIVTAAGLNIYPEDLEAALNRRPEVKESCVVGIEGAQGPEPLAVLILRNEDADAAEAVKRANASLNPAQQMRRWFVWPEPDFPRTATQKVRKPLVREKIEAALSGRAQATAETDQLVELIASVGGEAAAKLDSNASLSAGLKLDSLGRVALLSAIEDRYQIELDEAAITPETTLGEIERLIHQGARGEANVEYPYPKWSLRWPVNWVRSIAYYLLVMPFVLAMCWPRVSGRSRLRGLRGPVLFVANHISMVDPGILLFALPVRFRHRLAVAMAGERLRALRHPARSLNLFRRLLERVKYLLVVTVFNVFPLPQKSGFRRSFAFAGEAADSGYSVLVFPEGRVTEDGRMNPFMSGIGLLASQLDLPVVPVRIEGLFDLARERRYFSRPGTVTVTFGEPVEFARGTDPGVIAKELEEPVKATRTAF
jgi:long-chain acyl-CoA synthetase